MWANESVFYQIYPLGFCGAPVHNDGVAVNRIKKVAEFAEHIADMNFNAVYFSPLFESDKHGYDTRDYRKVDCRLGTNEDFADVCKVLHKNNIKVVLDGVFNHVGRGFWAFQDVLKNRENSPYKDWFHINFSGNSNYNDGLWYEGWEGHFDLVKLNLKNHEVVSHLFEAIKLWVTEFDIDGLRLDVAYSLDWGFLRQLRNFCKNLKEDFFLVGEIVHGDYNQLVNSQMLDSCTNYECYKGLFSSFNSGNLFEIGHSLGRQFGEENWTLYKGKHLMCFVDNHDVTRVASIIQNEKHIPLLYALLLTMPGIPCVYYGSEWGEKAEKSQGDEALRPYFEKPIVNEMSKYIAGLAKAHTNSKALCYGSFKVLLQTNKQMIFERVVDDERVIVMVNIEENSFRAHFNANAGEGFDLVTGKRYDFGGGIEIPGYSAVALKV